MRLLGGWYVVAHDALAREVVVGTEVAWYGLDFLCKEGSRVFARDSLGREAVLLEGQFWVRGARIDQDTW